MVSHASRDERRLRELFAWLKERRAQTAIRSRRVSLSEVMEHRFGARTVTDDRIKDCVALVKTVLHEREVREWAQPLMFSPVEHLCGLILKKAGGDYYGLMQAVEEPGIIGSCQVGPTVQTDIMPNAGKGVRQNYLPLFDNPRNGTLLFDGVQSEEGGRFFRDKKRYRAILLSANAVTHPEERYRWVPMGCLKRALSRENTVNMYVRTFMAMLL